MDSHIADYSKNLTDKVTLITGGLSGIGAASVRIFTQNGGKVAFCSSAIEKGEKLAEELNKSNTNGQTVFIPCEATIDEARVSQVVQETVAKFGRLDYLINNADTNIDHKAIDYCSQAEFQSLFDINVMTTFLFCKHSLPHIRLTKGSIVSVSSIASILGQEGAVPFVAAQAALDGLTKALAVDEAKHGVRVNSVQPTAIADSSSVRRFVTQTARETNSTEEVIVRHIAAAHLLNRVGTGRDVAGACLFLLAGSDFITGVNLPVSGGCELSFGPKV